MATWNTTLLGVGDMSISQDGTLLFVNDWTGHSIVALDARTGRTVRTYAYDQNTESHGIAYINAGARPTLIVGQGSVYDVASGNRYTTTIDAGRYRGNVSFAVDPLSRYFYTQNMGLSGSTVSKYSIKRTALNEEGLTIALVTNNSGGSNGQDICVSSDGTRLYTANGAPYMFYVFNTSSFQFLDQLPGSAQPENAECGWNGIFVGGASAYYETTDVWVCRADGSPLTSFKLGTTTYTSAAVRSLVLSGDNTRLIGRLFGLNTLQALAKSTKKIKGDAMGVVLGAVLLYVLVSVFNDGIEDEIRWKVLVIAILVIVIELGIQSFGESLYLPALLGSTILVALLLSVWCRLSRAVAGKVAASFLGIRVALGVLPLLLQRFA